MAATLVTENQETKEPVYITTLPIDVAEVAYKGKTFFIVTDYMVKKYGVTGAMKLVKIKHIEAIYPDLTNSELRQLKMLLKREYFGN